MKGMIGADDGEGRGKNEEAVVGDSGMEGRRLERGETRQEEKEEMPLGRCILVGRLVRSLPSPVLLSLKPGAELLLVVFQINKEGLRRARAEEGSGRAAQSVGVGGG